MQYSMKAYVVSIAFVLATPVMAEDSGGTLNPPEMGMDRVMQNIREGRPDMVTCASGYYITKKGDHEMARELFQGCAEAGWTGTMTWMSQLDNNGLGGEYDPDAAAEWDRRAADLGDRVGKFNHGINLLRGHGIAKDEILGRKMIDDAAAEGLAAAKRLQSAGYDLDEVTPDADNWKYAPLF